MENFGNDMYLSHPTIDFTLLDRPSTSLISACDSVTSLPKGETSLSSFNLFGGAEAVSKSNHLVASHGSFVPDTHKNIMWTDASRGFVTLPNPSEVHDFFEQGSHLAKSDLHSLPRIEDSAHHFLPRNAVANDELQRPFYHQNSFQASSQLDKTKHSKTVAARIPHMSVGFSNSVGGSIVDYSAYKGASFSARENSRNQESNFQAHLPSSNNFGLSSSPSIESGVPSRHPTVAHTGYFGTQYQKQVESYQNLSQTGAVFDHSNAYNFLEDQKLWQGVTQQPQTGSNKQAQIFMKIAKPSEPHLQQSQEMLLASSFKHLEDHSQEQGFEQQHTHVTRTSYSDLLHGPDTPPSQHSIAEDFENHESVFSLQNAEPVVWSGASGKLWYQGTLNGPGTEQNLPLSPQMSVFKEPVISCWHSGDLKDQNGPYLTPCMLGGVPENTGGSWKSSTLNHTGRPGLHSLNLGNQHMSEKMTADLGPVTGRNNEQRKINQLQGKVGGSQYSSGEALLKQQERTITQAHAFSQSQQFFQELHFSEQRNLLSDPKQPMSGSNVSRTHQALSFPKSTLKNGIHESFNSFITPNSLGKCMPQNSEGFPLDCFANSGQQEWLMSSSLGSPVWPMSVELAGCHEVSSGESLQAPQPSRGIDINLAQAHSVEYGVLGNINRHPFSQQESSVVGVFPGSFEALDLSQPGWYNAPKIVINSEIVPGGGSVATKQSSVALHDFQKDSSGANVSNGRAHPLSVPANEFQGAWKRYTAKPFPPGGGSSDQQPLDVLRPQQGIQHQAFLNAGPAMHTPAMPNNPIKTRAPYVSNQLVPGEQCLFKSGQLLEEHVYQDQTWNLPSANLMRAVSQQAMKEVPDAIKENQTGRKKTVECQDALLFERQQEMPQQQVNLCATNVSLAHLRGSQPSSSQSPHVRLGLGPSQDLQPSIDSNWSGLPYQQSLSGELPTITSGQASLSSDLSHCKSISERTRREEVELNQGTNVSTQRMVLPNRATYPSALTQRPPHILRKTAPSDASHGSTHVSRVVRGGNSFMSASQNTLSNEYNTRQELIQSKDKGRNDIFLGISQLQRSPSHSDALNTFSNKSLSIFSNPELHDDGSGVLPGHNRNPICGSTLSHEDGGSMGALPDCNLSNVSLIRQTSNIPDGSGSTGVTTASRASMLENPKSTVSNEYQISGILESSQILSSGVQGIYDEKKQGTSQRTPTMSTSSNSWRIEEQHSVKASSMKNTSNNQLNADRGMQSGNQAGVLIAPTLPSRMQGEGYNLSMSVDDGLIDLLQTRKAGQESHGNQLANSLDSDIGQVTVLRRNQAIALTASTSPSSVQVDGNHLSVSVDGGLTDALQTRRASHESTRHQHHVIPLDSDVGDTKTVEKNLMRPPLKAPSYSVIRSGIQLPAHKDPRQGQNFTGLEQIASAEQGIGTCTMPPEKTTLSNFSQKSRELGYTGVWSANQLIGNVHSSTTSDSDSRFETSQQDSVPISEKPDNREPVRTLEHLQPLKDLGKSDQAALSPKNLDDHDLTSSELKYTNEQAFEISPFPLQHPGFRESGISSSDSQVPSSSGRSIMKEEPITAPISLSKNMDCSSKFNHPGEVALTSKKRKKQHPLCNPWHIAMAQPGIRLPSDRDAEMEWATASNRLSEKDFNSTLENNASTAFQAKRRLKLTTESMQRLYPPLPDGLMRDRFAERECSIYTLAKYVLEDACRLVANTSDQAETSSSLVNMSCQCQFDGGGEHIDLTKCVESFMERVKCLGMELARLDCSTSLSELHGETHELEKLSIVNRLAKHHGMAFTMDSSDSLFIENNFECGVGSWKGRPQKYVTPVPMPRTLPEGTRCLPL